MESFDVELGAVFQQTGEPCRQLLDDGQKLGQSNYHLLARIARGHATAESLDGRWQAGHRFAQGGYPRGEFRHRSGKANPLARPGFKIFEDPGSLMFLIESFQHLRPAWLDGVGAEIVAAAQDGP